MHGQSIHSHRAPKSTVLQCLSPMNLQNCDLPSSHIFKQTRRFATPTNGGIRLVHKRLYLNTSRTVGEGATSHDRHSRRKPTCHEETTAAQAMPDPAERSIIACTTQRATGKWDKSCWQAANRPRAVRPCTLESMEVLVAQPPPRRHLPEVHKAHVKGDAKGNVRSILTTPV